MRTLPLSLVMLAICAASASAQETPSDVTFTRYYAPAHSGIEVSIESSTGSVSTIVVPANVMLSVAGSEEENPRLREMQGASQTFRGDLTIRMVRADDIDASVGSLASDMMAQAPMEVTVESGVVTVNRKD